MSPAALRSLRIQLAGHRQQALERSRQRLVIGVLLFIALAIVVGLRLFDLSVLQAIRRGPGVDILATLKPPRADIIDRNGEVLATSIKVQSLAVRPHLVINDREALVERISRALPDLDPSFIRRQVMASSKFRYLKRRLTPEEVARINAIGEPGLEFQDETERVYPNGKLAAHVLGYTDIDNEGRAGIERSFNERMLDPARLSKPMQLSIDVRVQHALEYELQAAMNSFAAIGAAGVVMDVRTGEVLAMASLPVFDPNAVNRSPNATWFNRATLGVYELGSTFKAFTTAIALDTGVVTIDKRYDATVPLKVGRFTINDDHPKKRWLTIPEIFIYSSNIGTAQMAVDSGTQTQIDYMRKLGFLEPEKIELAETAQPLYPKVWGKIATMTVGYGHGIAVTPLHLASGMAALVNGGVWRPATLLKLAPGAEPAAGDQVFSPETSRQMRALLRMVVTDGTGRKADAPGYRVGGKTGTAEKPGVGGYRRKSLISTFAAAFPMDDPRYVVIASIDEPQGNKESYGYATAGWVAAPVIKALVERAGPILGVEPDIRRDVDTRAYDVYIAEKQQPVE